MVLCTLLATSTAEAQLRPPHYDVSTVIVGNAVIGGVSAAMQAKLSGKPFAKALLGGFLGGALHGSGKTLSPGAPLAGYALGAAGVSIAANAGRGAGYLDEVVLPIGPGRLRITREPRARIDATLNAFESAMLARRLFQPGTRFDLTQSLLAGTVVLRTSAELFNGAGSRAAGITSGSVILLSDHASKPEETLKHERIHAHQAWFIQELWGRPVESSLRRTPVGRLIPRWLELGVTMPALQEIERQTLGSDGPFRSWREGEAESLEGPPRR